MRTIEWTLGNERLPEDRRRIRTSGADTDRLMDLGDFERIEILDLISGEWLTLERIECGAHCRCAVGIVSTADHPAGTCLPMCEACSRLLGARADAPGVSMIYPGTPEWDLSEIELEAQRRAGG